MLEFSGQLTTPDRFSYHTGAQTSGAQTAGRPNGGAQTSCSALFRSRVTFQLPKFFGGQTSATCMSTLRTKYVVATPLILQHLSDLILTMVPRQFVYRHFVYDTSYTDISFTDILSTTVYQDTGQLYIQLLFQQFIIFINSNFYLHYDSLYQSHFH